MTGHVRRPTLTGVTCTNRTTTSRQLSNPTFGAFPSPSTSANLDSSTVINATALSRSMSHSALNINIGTVSMSTNPSKSFAHLTQHYDDDSYVPPSPDDKLLKAAESSSLPLVTDSLARDPFVSISRAIHSARLRAGAGLRTMAAHNNNLKMQSKASRFRDIVYGALKAWRPIMIVFFLTTTLCYVYFSVPSLSSQTYAPSTPKWTSLLNPFAKSVSRTPPDYRSSLDIMLHHRPAAYRSPTFQSGPWLIALVADEDRESCQKRDDTTDKLRVIACMGATVWVSYFKRGILTLPLSHKSSSRSLSPNITWLDEMVLEDARKAYDSLSITGNRGMELSELEWFNGKLLAPDDHAGILTEISSPYGGLDFAGHTLLPGIPTNIPPGVRRKALLLDGDGSDQSQLFKGEWMVIKDGELLIGGHGRPYTAARDGSKILSVGPKWVKTVKDGMNVSHTNWTKQYDEVAKAGGVEWPGYLMHEAVLWSNDRREWVFLPRRRSTEAFEADKNQHMGWNVAIVSSEDLKSFRQIVIDGLTDRSGTRGFSSAKFVPGSKDRLVAALRTVELDWKVGDVWSRKTESYISVFDLDSGEMVLEETKMSDKKFEGLVFL